MKRALTMSLGLLVFAGFLDACERNPKTPGYEIALLTDMVYSVPYDAFQKNDDLPGGKTLQTPPFGSIPRGHQLFPYAKSEDEAVRAGLELKNPIAPTPEVLARGQRAYENFCLVCHGPQGQGDGPLIPKFPNPPSFTSKRVKEFSDGRLFYVITRGGSIMPPHNTQIDPEDRWKIVHYVRTLQQTKP